MMIAEQCMMDIAVTLGILPVKVIRALDRLIGWVFFLLPYFFSYRMRVFIFENNHKNLYPSYKMDLDLWDNFGRESPIL